MQLHTAFFFFFNSLELSLLLLLLEYLFHAVQYEYSRKDLVNSTDV